MALSFIIFLDHHPIPQLRVYKCTPYVAFVGILPDIVFDQYVMEVMGGDTATKNVELVHFCQFLLGMFVLPCLGYVIYGSYVGPLHQQDPYSLIFISGCFYVVTSCCVI